MIGIIAAIFLPAQLLGYACVEANCCRTLTVNEFENYTCVGIFDRYHTYEPYRKQMQEAYTRDTTFDKTDFSENPLTKGEYEGCAFNGCSFADCDLSSFRFIGCTFTGCNLSLAKLNKTALQNVAFKDCKMLGQRFDTCQELGLSFSFDNCQLDHSSFYRTKIKKTLFRNSKLHETDFAECDLTGAKFEHCDLLRAIFDKTIIEKADFRTSYNYSIDPEVNRIRKAKFSLSGVSGLLDKYDIDIERDA